MFWFICATVAMFLAWLWWRKRDGPSVADIASVTEQQVMNARVRWQATLIKRLSEWDYDGGIPMITLEERSSPEGRQKRQPYLSAVGDAQAWLDTAIHSDRWLVNVEVFDPADPNHRLDYFDFLGHIREKKASRWIPAGTTALIYAIGLASALEHVDSIAFDHSTTHDTMPDVPEHLQSVLNARERASTLASTVAGQNATVAQILHIADQVTRTLRLGAPSTTPIPAPSKPTALLVRLGESEDT